VTRLDEYDQLEWWDVARRINPDLTWEQFDADWQEFTAVVARVSTARRGWVPPFEADGGWWS
jgi:hypothetical protein